MVRVSLYTIVYIQEGSLVTDTLLTMATNKPTHMVRVRFALGTDPLETHMETLGPEPPQQLQLMHETQSRAVVHPDDQKLPQQIYYMANAALCAL